MFSCLCKHHLRKGGVIAARISTTKFAKAKEPLFLLALDTLGKATHIGLFLFAAYQQGDQIGEFFANSGYF
jgi:hypothetical protein